MKIRHQFIVWTVLTLSVQVPISTLRAQDTASEFDSEKIAQLRAHARELFGPIPENMPGAENDTPDRIALGEKLFFEKNLSLNRTQSCNSCHRVDENLGGVDNQPTSPGAFGSRGGRNAPTVLNAGFQFAQFWDGRAANLEEQAKGPVLNPIEMAMPDQDLVIQRLKEDAHYPDLFRKAFPDQADPLTYDNAARAIASFERTLKTQDRFDDWQKGNDGALTAQELRGLEKFLRNGCTTCHNGPLLGGTAFQKLGIINPYENFSDKGREEVTENEADRYRFKVPTLRNIALTPPYFHDGGVATLEFAGRKMAWMQLGLQLSDEDVKDIVAFLKTLTDKDRAERTQD